MGLPLWCVCVVAALIAQTAYSTSDAAIWLSLMWAFIGIITLCLIAVVVFRAGLWVWHFFHAVEISERSFGCRYWPLQEVIQVDNVEIHSHESVRRIAVDCRVVINSQTIAWPRASVVTGAWTLDYAIYSPQFAQIPAKLTPEPSAGTTVIVTISAKPTKGFGRSAERTVPVSLAITDHRP